AMARSAFTYQGSIFETLAQFKKLWMLYRHLHNRKFPCRPNVITPLISPIQVPDPLPETNPIQIPDPIQDPEITPVIPPNLSPKASKQKTDTSTPQRTRLTINKRPDESEKEWAIRLADRSDKVTHIKQNRSWLRRRGENFKSCIENKFLSLLQTDPEVWQERERIGGYTIERRYENGEPIPQIDSEAGPGPSTQANREEVLKNNSVNESNITQEEIDLLIALGLIEEPEIEESWPELGGTLLADKAKSKKFKSRYRDSGFDSIAVKAPSGDILFEETEVGDPDRPHLSLSSLSKWQAIVPSYENPAYDFNAPIDDPEKYAEAPYMPQLIASAREQITSVLKAELRRKDQIKSAIVVYCNYMKMEKKGEGKVAVPFYIQSHHRGEMRAILSEQDIDEHITLSAGEIDVKIEEFLRSGSGWTLIRIEMIYIEVYAYRRAVGGSFKPTPKNLANTKCTINPDNSKTGDDMCLKYAFGPYFATLDGITKNLQRLSVIKPYLNIVNLDGIPMPTPICPRTFQKIEAQNPEISINVWEWKEETATPKPVIASKNFYIPNSCQVAGCEHPRPNECMTKRPHVIHLMALTDVNKSEDTENTRDYHQDHCYGLGEAPQ
ncbi:18344_t:CDS:2, partial [Entrophospora sp. SA101]